MVVRSVAGAVVAYAAWESAPQWGHRTALLEGFSPDDMDLPDREALVARATAAIGTCDCEGWHTGRAPGDRFVVGLCEPRYALSTTTLDSLATGLSLLVERDLTMATARMNALLQERARIASEIHQGACQEIATLNLQLQILSEVLHRDPASAGPLLKEIERSAHLCSDNLRSAIVHLTPISPDDNWLDGGLQGFVSDLCAAWNMRIDLEIIGTIRVIDAEALELIFAFVQEGLTNMRKHASSKRGVVRITFRQRTLGAEVTDHIERDAALEGRAAVAPFGHGLSLMRSRARLLGGDVEFVRFGRHGTRLAMEIPA